MLRGIDVVAGEATVNEFCFHSEKQSSLQGKKLLPMVLLMSTHSICFHGEIRKNIHKNVQ